MTDLINKTVVGATAIVFIYLLFHCATLHYTFRNVLFCFDKYKLNRYTNDQAADVYRSSMTFYTIRSLLNVINVFADVNALTALLMTFVNGAIRSRSRCLLVRCCCDVRDSLAMYLGCSVVLTVISCLCRKAETFLMVMSPYDTVGCCGVKELVYLKGRLDNPEYSANAVSRFVGFSIIDALLTGFKLEKQKQHAAAVSAIARPATTVEAPKSATT
ncbi:uncharacterized protein [Dermacentor albipictus]|uniref:uncharacterized protein isoform X2 n=1 Tax=Dermacentor albipictus TaxID=60249 RepID=UPI0038FCF49D